MKDSARGRAVNTEMEWDNFLIGIYTTDFKNEFISLTDIARYKSIDPRITIHNWLRGRDVVEFLGLWEILHNPDFKRIDFDTFKEDAICF